MYNADVMRRFIIRVLLPTLCGLSSCYSNYNQGLLKPHRVYEGWHLDYESKSLLMNKKVWAPLPQVIYRVGQEWYIAGFKAEYKATPWNVPHFFADRATEQQLMLNLTSRGAVHYHRITPRLAGMLLKPFGNTRISTRLLHTELKKAGGEWLPTLPKKAVAVEVPYFHASNRKLRWDVTDRYRSAVPWYKYPLAAVVFAGVDVPLSVLGNVGFVASLPVTWPLGAYVAQKKDFYDSGDTRVWIWDKKLKIYRTMTPEDKGPYIFQQN